MKKKPWLYEAYQALKIPAGRYQLWIFASSRFGYAYSAGKSGCAFEIRNELGDIIAAPAPLVTERDQSSQWRGYVAAVTRGIELTPNNSTLVVCSRHETILHSIEAVDHNKQNGWRNSKGEKLQDIDIWERFLLARNGTSDRPRKIMVVTRKADTDLDAEIIERLQKKTAAALDKVTGKKKRRK